VTKSRYHYRDLSEVSEIITKLQLLLKCHGMLFVDKKTIVICVMCDENGRFKWMALEAPSELPWP
jgi:hypothetical protein